MPTKGEAFSTPGIAMIGSDIPMVASGSPPGPLGVSRRMTPRDVAKPAASWNCVNVDEFHAWNLVVDDALTCLGGHALNLPRPGRHDLFVADQSADEALATLSAAQTEYDDISSNVYSYLLSDSHLST